MKVLFFPGARWRRKECQFCYMVPILQPCFLLKRVALKMTMSTVRCWKNTDSRKPKYSKTKLPQWHLVHHKSPPCQPKCRSLIIKFRSTAFKSFVKKKDASSCVASFISPNVRGLVLNILSYRNIPRRKTLHGYKCGYKGSVTTNSLHKQDTVSKMQIF